MEEMILLTEWAEKHGVQVQAAIRRAKYDAFVTAEKIDGRWWIRADEPNADKRSKQGRLDHEQYVRKMRNWL